MTVASEGERGRAVPEQGDGTNSQPLPWYRHRWPWILMAGPFAAVVGSLLSAWLAIANADPVIDEDYYEHGLQINSKLQQQEAAQRASAVSVPTRSPAVRPNRRSADVSD
ncbi:MAG: FixH family protein [Burkholderiaceae bacterium]|nr:FixH family protein [Burkholderiaceae bacterium]